MLERVPRESNDHSRHPDILSWSLVILIQKNMIRYIYLHVYICVYTYDHSFPYLNKNEPFLEHHLPCFFFLT